MKIGEIWLVNFPFTDGSSTKLRPVLLVSADKFHFDGEVPSGCLDPPDNCGLIPVSHVFQVRIAVQTVFVEP